MRGRFSSHLSVACFLLGLTFFLLSIPLFNYLQKNFKKKEGYYQAPIFLTTFSSLVLRNDSHGKGFFGAPREGGRLHQGIDILAPVGSPVIASKSGRVLFSGQGKGYGKYIEISHPDGLSTRYAHLLHAEAKKGDWVNCNDIIGSCGKSGNAKSPSIKPHLHFEIITIQGPLNPMNLLDPNF